MALGDSTTQSHRNLWIILGSCLGVLVVALILSTLWFCLTRLQGRGLLPTRTVTPLGDDVFESWRRSSTYTQRPGHYTVIAKPQPVMTRTEMNSVAIFDKEALVLDSRPHTPTDIRWPQSPNFSRPTNKGALRRNSSIYSLDRPPTPYSPSRSSKDGLDPDAPASPRSPARPKKAQHHHYPSVSEVSDFHFDIEKTPIHWSDGR